MNAKVGFNEVQNYAKTHNVDFKTAAQKLGLTAQEAAELERLGGDPGAPEDGFKRTPANSFTLKSGRKVNVYKDSTGKQTFEYLAADGTKLKESYFLKQEGLTGSHFAVNDKGQLVTVKDEVKAEEQAEEKGFFAKAWNKIKSDVSGYSQNFVNAWNNSEGFLETTGSLIGATTKTVTDAVTNTAENIEKGVAEVTGSETVGKVAKYAAGVGLAADAVEAVDKVGDWGADKIRAAAQNYTGTEKALLEGFADFVEDMNAADIALMFVGGVGAAKYAKDLPKIMNLLKISPVAAGAAATVATVASLTSCTEDNDILPEKIEITNNAIVNISIADQTALINAFKEGIDALLEKIDELYNKLGDIEISLEEFKDEVISLIVKNNSYLSNIYAELTEQGETQDEILSILTNINSTVNTIESLVENTNENIVVYGQNVNEKLTEILNAIKDGNTNSLDALEGYMEELRTLLINVINNQSEDIQINEANGMTLEKILETLQNMDGTTSEKLEQMLEILESIKAIGESIISKFDDLFANNEAILSAIEKIQNYLEKHNDQTTVTNQLLEQLLEMYESNNVITEETLTKILEAIAENGEKIDVTNELITNIQTQSTEFQNQVLEILANVGTEYSEILNNILEATQNNGNKLDTVTELLAKIQKQDAKFQKKVLALLEKYGSDSSSIINQLEEINELLANIQSQDETFQNNVLDILTNISESNTDYTEVLNKILDAIGNNSSQLTELTELINNMSNTNATFQQNVLDILNNLATSDIPDYTEILNDILKSIGSNSTKLDNITKLLSEIKSQNADFQKKIINAINKLGVDISTQLTDITTAINNASSDTSEKIEALLDKVLEAINNNTSVSNENAAKILEAIANIEISGGSIDLSSIEAMLQELLDLTSSNNDLLGNIDAKLEVINLTIEAAKNEIIEKLGSSDSNAQAIIAKLEEFMNLSNANSEAILKKMDTIINLLNNISDKTYDDSELMAKLDDILEAIKDHDITIDVSGNITCECNCGNSGNHEGILGNLEDILG